MAAIPVTSGLQLLLDARTITGLSDGAAVSAWADTSGQGNNAAQATAGRQPTYRTGVIGSNPVVRFAGGDDSMFGSFSAWGTGFCALVLVTGFIHASTSDFAGILNFHQGSGNDWQTAGGCSMEVGAATPNTRRGYNITHNSTTGLLGGTESNRIPVPTLPSVVGYALSASTLRIVSNGLVTHEQSVTRTIGNATGYVLAQRYLSGAVSTANGLAADFGLAVAYNRAPSIAELEDVSQWMLAEYGLATFGTGTSAPAELPGDYIRLMRGSGPRQ